MIITRLTHYKGCCKALTFVCKLVVLLVLQHFRIEPLGEIATWLPEKNNLTLISFES